MDVLLFTVIGGVLLAAVLIPVLLFGMSRERAAQTKSPGPAMDRFLDGSPTCVVYEAAFKFGLGEISRLAAERGYEYVQTVHGKVGPEHTFRKVR